MHGSWDQKPGVDTQLPCSPVGWLWLNYLYLHRASEFTTVFRLGTACTTSDTAPSGESPGETPFRFQHLSFVNIQKSYEHPKSNWFHCCLPHSGPESQGWDDSLLLTSMQYLAVDTKTLGDCSHTSTWTFNYFFLILHLSQSPLSFSILQFCTTVFNISSILCEMILKHYTKTKKK